MPNGKRDAIRENLFTRLQGISTPTYLTDIKTFSEDRPPRADALPDLPALYLRPIGNETREPRTSMKRLDRTAFLAVLLYSTTFAELEKMVLDVYKAVEGDATLGGLTYLTDRPIVTNDDFFDAGEEVTREVEAWSVVVAVPYITAAGDI